MRHHLAALGLALLSSAGCASTRAGAAASPPAPAAATASQDTSSVDRPQYPSTYQRHANPAVVIRLRHVRIDHECKGVPLKQSLFLALSRHAALVTLLCGFLMACDSSSNT